jgi:hypothetical protein
MSGPYNFNSQWKTLRNLVLSADSQTAWNTAVEGTNMTRRQVFDGNAIMELAQTRRSDVSYAGKTTAFATNGQVTSWDTKFDGFKTELDDWLVGWMFAFLMGVDTVTGSGPYVHTFTFDETTRTAVPTSLYLEDTEAVEYTFADFCVNDLTLQIQDIGAISAEFTGMGTGRYTAGAIGSLPSVPTRTYLLGSDAVLALGGDNLLGRHMSTTLKLENQNTVHKAPGGGLYGIFQRKGDPKFSISTTIAAKDTDDILTLLENDTSSDLVLTIDSASAAQLVITIPVCHFKSTKLGFDKDMTIWQLEADETSAYDVSGTPPISIQVTNSVAAYLAAG